MENAIRCPDCNGEGTYSTDEWDAIAERHYTVEHDCERCDGTGEVDA